MEYIQEEMRGVIVALTTGFDEGGRIRFEPVGRHIDACIAEGVHGFWVNGASGLATYLEEEERRELAERAAERIGERVPMWIHVGGASTPISCRLAAHARKQGATGVSSMPPLLYATSLDRIAEHLTAIQEAAGLPLTYYHVPGLTKVALEAGELLELCERVPELTAIKFSDIDIFKAVVIRERAPGVRLMSGFEEILLAGLALGCFDGAVGAGQNFLPGPLVDVYDAYCQGDLERARHIHRAIARLLDIQGQFDFTAATYAFLNLLGFDVGRPRSPMQYLGKGECRLVRELSLQVIGAEPFEQQRLIRTGDFLDFD